MGRAQRDRVWLVTGASTEFARVLCDAVLRRGERLVATARRRDAIANLERSAPDRVLGLELDVTDAEAVPAAVDTAVRRFGHIDVLVNNAGPTLTTAPTRASGRTRARGFDVHVEGALLVTRAVLPHMRARGSGRIVQMSSVTGVRAEPEHELYAGSKFALDGVSEALAAGIAASGVRILIVEPGPPHVDVSHRYGAWVAQVIAAVDSDDPPLRLTLDNGIAAGSNPL